MRHRLVEQLDVVVHHRQVALEQDGIRAQRFKFRDGFFRLDLRGIAVVVDGDTACTGLGELSGDKRAQVLAATGNDGNLAGKGTGVGHGVCSR